MDYEAVFIDLDGTLLRSDGEIAAVSKESISRAQSLGVKVVVNTARILMEAHDILERSCIRSAIISNNGAYIQDISGNIVSKKAILTKSVIRLIEFSIEKNISLSCATPKGIYYSQKVGEMILNKNRQLKQKGMVVLDSDPICVADPQGWLPVLACEENNIMMCELYCDTLDRFHDVRKEFSSVEGLELTSSEPPIIEFTSSRISKGSGMSTLLGYYDIDAKRCMAIGDSENDLTMMNLAGWSISMGNAIHIVKEKANYITASNDEDGVAKAIDRFILKSDGLF